MSDLDNLLDSTLDDIADLPTFEPFPPGAHRVTISFAEKKINEHPAVEIKFKMVECLELSEPETTKAPDPGSEYCIAYMLDNEFGAGKFKEVLKPIAAATGTQQIRAILEAGEGMEVVIVTKLRTDKEDKDKKYMDLKKLEVV
jgi:hypothetical protein